MPLLKTRHSEAFDPTRGPIQTLERERRELYARNVQGEPREGGIKDVEKLIADQHAYYNDRIGAVCHELYRKNLRDFNTIFKNGN